MHETFASYVEALEGAGLPGGFRQLQVPLLLEGERVHLRRSTGIRLCDWRIGGEEQTQTVGELLTRDDLCDRCLPGALGTHMNAWDTGEAGTLILATLCLATVTGARSASARLERGQAVSTARVYEHLHGHRRLLDEVTGPRIWQGAPVALLAALEERLVESRDALKEAVRGDAQKERVLQRIRRADARLKETPVQRRDRDPEVELLMAYTSDVVPFLSKLPMLASEAIATFGVTDRGVTALLAPGRVVNYLDRVAVRARDWRLRSFDVAEVPADRRHLETALGIWDPTGNGPLRGFSAAVQAAELLG